MSAPWRRVRSIAVRRPSDYDQCVRFVVRFVVQVAALIGVVVFAIFFLGARSDVNEQADRISSSTVGQSSSSVAANRGSYAPATLVGGAEYDINAVVASRPVVFWFWAPG